MYAQKLLNNLVDLGKLERRGRLYALPGSRSEGKEHALAVTECIAELYRRFENLVVYREKTIEEVGLRPDLIAFIKRDQKGLCFVLEVIEQESPEYLRMKRNVWETWEGAKAYLSNLFNTTIPQFDFVVSGEFESYLEELCKI